MFSSFVILFLFVKDKSRTKGGDIKDAIYVTMEILSNWGHASWVGLTEVEFFDLHDTKLYVSPHDVDIRTTDTPGDLGQLVNRNLAVSGGSTGVRFGLVFWCIFSAHDRAAVQVWGGEEEQNLPLSFIWAQWEEPEGKVQVRAPRIPALWVFLGRGSKEEPSHPLLSSLQFTPGAAKCGDPRGVMEVIAIIL